MLKRGEHGYERKREKKREKRNERREKGKKGWSKVGDVRPEKFQFLKKGQNRNFDYKIVISVKNP